MKHRWGLYFAVEDYSRPKPRRHTQNGIDTSQLKDIRPVSIESAKLFVTIHGLIADVTVRSSFRNNEIDHIDGFFLFPVEYDAALYHFEASVGGRQVVAACREKGENYEMSLLEELQGEGILLEESSSDMFTCHIGVVSPEEQVDVIFQYSIELSISEQGDVRFLFPTFVPKAYQSRYLDFAQKHLPQDSFNVDDYGFDFQFQGVIAGNYMIRDVLSREVLEIDFLDQSKYNAKLMLAGGYQPNRDFTFSIKYADIESPHILVQRSVPEGVYDHVVMKSHCALYTMFHRLHKASQQSKKGEFIICIDRSGSMRGVKMQHAREALLYFLKSLPQGCYFNVISFGSFYTPLFKTSRVYNKYNVMKALKLQLKMKADMTATDILPVLEYIYDQPRIAGHPKQIFILTDGAVSNTRDCVDYVHARTDFARIFTFGIGETASRQLVSGLARAAQGKAHFLKITEKPYNKVVECLKRSMQPGLTKLELEFDTPAGVTALTIPPNIPPVVFAEEKFSVYILLRGEPNDMTDTTCSVTMTGMLGKEPYSHTLNFDLATALLNDNLPLHRLAMKQEIRDLEKSIDNALGADDILENQYHLVQASIAANIPSRYSPLIGIDSQTGEEVEGFPIIRMRPEDSPFGVTASGMDIYMPHAGSVYKSMSRLTLTRLGNNPSAFVQKIFDPSRTGKDSRMYDFSDIGDSSDLLESPDRPHGAAIADIDSDLALSEVYMEVTDKDEWAKFKEELKEPSALTKYQHRDGYWMLDKQIAYAFGSTITEVKKENPLRDDIIWTTILSLNWLKCNFDEQYKSWKSAEQRAIRWLNHQELEGYTVDELLECASELPALDGHVHFQPDKPQESMDTIEEEPEEVPYVHDHEREGGITYIRQESISAMAEDIDNMDEDLYADDDVPDLYNLIEEYDDKGHGSLDLRKGKKNKTGQFPPLDAPSTARPAHWKAVDRKPRPSNTSSFKNQNPSISVDVKASVQYPSHPGADLSQRTLTQPSHSTDLTETQQQVNQSETGNWPEDQSKSHLRSPSLQASLTGQNRRHELNQENLLPDEANRTTITNHTDSPIMISTPKSQKSPQPLQRQEEPHIISTDMTNFESPGGLSSRSNLHSTPKLTGTPRGYDKHAEATSSHRFDTHTGPAEATSSHRFDTHTGPAEATSSHRFDTHTGPAEAFRRNSSSIRSVQSLDLERPRQPEQTKADGSLGRLVSRLRASFRRKPKDKPHRHYAHRNTELSPPKDKNSITYDPADDDQPIRRRQPERRGSFLKNLKDGLMWQAEVREMKRRGISLADYRRSIRRSKRAKNNLSTSKNESVNTSKGVNESVNTSEVKEDEKVIASSTAGATDQHKHAEQPAVVSQRVSHSPASRVTESGYDTRSDTTYRPTIVTEL